MIIEIGMKLSKEGEDLDGIMQLNSNVQEP